MSHTCKKSWKNRKAGYVSRCLGAGLQRLGDVRQDVLEGLVGGTSVVGMRHTYVRNNSLALQLRCVLGLVIA